MELKGKIITKYPLTKSNGSTFQKFIFEDEKGEKSSITAYAEDKVLLLNELDLQKEYIINVNSKDGRIYFEGKIPVDRHEHLKPIIQNIDLEDKLKEEKKEFIREWCTYRYNSDLRREVISPDIHPKDYIQFFIKAMAKGLQPAVMDTLIAWQRGCRHRTIDSFIKEFKYQYSINPEMKSIDLNTEAELIRANRERYPDNQQVEVIYNKPLTFGPLFNYSPSYIFTLKNGKEYFKAKYSRPGIILDKQTKAALQNPNPEPIIQGSFFKINQNDFIEQ